MKLLFFLLGAHFLYDFSLQGSFVALMKKKHVPFLFIHAFAYTFILSLVLSYFDKFNWGAVIWIFATHLIIDYGEANLQEDNEDKLSILWIGQIFHVLTLVLAWFYLR
jgi:hypothetical protein